MQIPHSGVRNAAPVDLHQYEVWKTGSASIEMI